MYPSDVLLPANAKYYGFIDTKRPFNIHHDIIWSFSFALTGVQHGYTTFLTTTPSTTGGIPGQRLSYLGNSAYDTTGFLAIAFDTTGLFALSTVDYTGVGENLCLPNSILVRDYQNQLIYNERLSNLDTTFFLTSAVKNYQTLRFRVCNAGKSLYIDKLQNNSYINLNKVLIPGFSATNNNVYVGFSYSSPISSSSITPSTLYLKNFHIQGLSTIPTYETCSFTSINVSPDTTFSSISNIL